MLLAENGLGYWGWQWQEGRCGCRGVACRHLVVMVLVGVLVVAHVIKLRRSTHVHMPVCNCVRATLVTSEQALWIVQRPGSWVCTLTYTQLPTTGRNRETPHRTSLDAALQLPENP